MDCSLFGSCRATAYRAGVLDNFYSIFEVFLTPRNESDLGCISTQGEGYQYKLALRENLTGFHCGSQCSTVVRQNSSLAMCGAFLQYFTMPPHSTWNPCGTDLFHVESMESTWNPHGIHMESMWNAPNISTYSQVRLKFLISLIS